MSAEASVLYIRVIRFADPLGIAAAITSVASIVDIVVVGGYLEPVTLAVYNATVAISSLLSALFVVPLSTTLFAEIAYSFQKAEQVARGVSLAFRFSAFTVLPASFLSAAMATQLIVLFSRGGQYMVGVPSLQLITLFYLLLVIETIVLYVLQGVGKTKDVLVIGAFTAIIGITLSVVLVPRFGLEGAAVSRVVVMAIGCAMSMYFIRDYLKGFRDFEFFAKALVASASPAIVVYALSVFVSSRLFTLLPYSVAAIAIFLLSERVLGLLSAEDKSFLEGAMPAQLRWIGRLL